MSDPVAGKTYRITHTETGEDYGEHEVVEVTWVAAITSHDIHFRLGDFTFTEVAPPMEPLPTEPYSVIRAWDEGEATYNILILDDIGHWGFPNNALAYPENWATRWEWVSKPVTLIEKEKNA